MTVNASLTIEGDVVRGTLTGDPEQVGRAVSKLATGFRLVAVAGSAAPAPIAGQRERIACGSTHPDPHTEAAFVAARTAIDAPPDTSGCGRSGEWTYMYRCAECARWFHRSCITKHFRAHSEPLNRIQP